jgi:hypothetical protein
MTIRKSVPSTVPTSKSVSRRSVVNVLVKSSAVAVAAVIPSAAIASGNVDGPSALPAQADSELLQLGIRLTRANRQIEALSAKPDLPDEEMTEALKDLAALMLPIFSCTATTRDGLAVQAAAAVSACREIWDYGDGDFNGDGTSLEVERPFIEAVCRFTGVEHPTLNGLAVPAVGAAVPAAHGKAAMVRRAEEIVEIFSDRYIREGWNENFDKERAAEFLENVRRIDIAAEDIEHEQKILAWAKDHGVSLDWLLNGDPSGMICYHAKYVAPPRNVPDEVAQIADNMLGEYDRLGTLGRNIEPEDWETYDSLDKQLWKTPAKSIDGVIAKARVLDQRYRLEGKPHSILKKHLVWRIVDDVLALGVQS